MKTSTHPRKNATHRRIPRRAIDRVAKNIADHFSPEQIILFGSYAYGKPHPYSDVDFLVIMETNERPLAKQMEISRALSPHPFGMDILVRTPKQLQERLALGDSFMHDITTKGKVLYERTRS